MEAGSTDVETVDVWSDDSSDELQITYVKESTHAENIVKVEKRCFDEYEDNDKASNNSESIFDENEFTCDEPDEYIDTDSSPIKKSQGFDIYQKNQRCRLITSLESTENPFIVPMLMNCKQENPEIISDSVPFGIQQNASLIIDLESLDHKSDILSDDNGVWVQNGCKTKFFVTTKESNDRVVGLVRVGKDDRGDIAVRRRYYICKSCPSYHRLIVTVEFGRNIDQWHPMAFVHYRYDGEEVKFDVAPHGNQHDNDAKPYVRTKGSTKMKSTQQVHGNGPKRALFKTIKDLGGVSKAESQGTLPRNARQMRYLKKAEDKEKSKASRDPLASVIEMQKSILPGFVREIICNDLPTVILFTDEQVDNIIKFCCLQKRGFVSELGVDLTFQLGPFYLLVTTYKNTLLQVKKGGHSPVFLGPMMICMTKDQQTYLSFVHRLVREVPGLAKYLHAYGTDSEDALTNALAAGFQNSAHLLCYIHCKKNVQEKAKQIGLSEALSSQICSDLFGRHGLVWCQSSEAFEKQTTKLVEKWNTLESSERKGEPKFSSYFLKFKKQEMKTKMCRFVVSALGLEDAPYTQNVVECVNDIIKDWVNFTAQDMDKLIMALYDLVGSFDEEEELAWFGLSEKWQVKAEYKRFSPQAFNDLTPDERKGEIARIRKIRPDATAYRNCKTFKFTSSQPENQVGGNSSVFTIQPVVLQSLTKHFSQEEVTGMRAKAEALLQTNKFREGFQDGAYFVDSGEKVPYKVTCFKSGKTTCSCSYYSRNSICFHCIAIAKHKGRMSGLVKNYPGRNLNTVATTSAPKGVGSKKPPPRQPRKRRYEASATSTSSLTSSSTGNEESTTFSVKNVNPTSLVITKNKKPADPVTSSPLVLKRIAGGIRKCSGCGKGISSIIPGFESEEDSLFCVGRHEAYFYWNKGEECYKITSGVRHYHMNAVCTKSYMNSTSTISSARVQLSDNLQNILTVRFNMAITD